MGNSCTAKSSGRALRVPPMPGKSFVRYGRAMGGIVGRRGAEGSEGFSGRGPPWSHGATAERGREYEKRKDVKQSRGRFRSFRLFVFKPGRIRSGDSSSVPEPVLRHEGCLRGELSQSHSPYRTSAA